MNLSRLGATHPAPRTGLAALLTLCRAALLLPVPSAHAQLAHRLDTVSAWGGAVNAFQKVGTIAYCGRGQRFVVLDVSNEANIHEVGGLNLDSTVEDFAIRGNYAYVVCGANPHVFLVCDISVPTSPRVIWDAPLFASGLSRIQLYGNLAYLTRLAQGAAYVFDLTDPAHPVGPSFIFTFGTGGSATSFRDLRIVGDYVYVLGRSPTSSFDHYLSVFNLQPDPLHPTELIGRVQIPGAQISSMHLDVRDGRAIAQIQIQDSLGLRNVARLFDVSDPHNPVLTGGYDDLFGANGVAVQGTYALVADWLNATSYHSPLDSAYDRLKGLAILDISNPSSPTLLTTYNTDHSSIRDVRVEGNRAYVFCDGQGLEVLDISNIGPQSPPIKVGGYYSPSSLREMTKDGNRLYMVDEFNGFTILDVSNPSAAPTVLGVYRGQGSIRYQGHWGVQVRNGLAYLAAGHGGIQVVDVSNPASPTFLYQYREPVEVFDVRAVELDGDVLHAIYGRLPRYDAAAGEASYYTNFDVSAQPIAVLGRIITRFGPHLGYGPTPHRLTTKQGISFYGNASDGPNLNLHCDRIDTRLPAQPTYLYPQLDPWGCSDMEIVGNTLYAASSSNQRFDIVDVTDPVNASWTGSVSAGQCFSVAGVGSRAYVGWYSHLSPPIASIPGASALDCSNPASPSLLSEHRCFGEVEDLVASGDMAYAVTGDPGFGEDYTRRGGLTVMRYHCTADFDMDGTVAPADIAAFVNVWFTSLQQGTLAGDFDSNGSVQPSDIAAFVNAWFTALTSGC